MYFIAASFVCNIRDTFVSYVRALSVFNVFYYAPGCRIDGIVPCVEHLYCGNDGRPHPNPSPHRKGLCEEWLNCTGIYLIELMKYARRNKARRAEMLAAANDTHTLYKAPQGGSWPHIIRKLLWVMGFNHLYHCRTLALMLAALVALFHNIIRVCLKATQTWGLLYIPSFSNLYLLTSNILSWQVH